MKTLLTAAIFAVAITFAPVAAAQKGGNHGGAFLAGIVGCAAGLASAVHNAYKDTRREACGIGGVTTLALYFIITHASSNFAPGVDAAPKSRWYFDGDDGSPKVVYPLSDAGELSFGAKGEAFDYDGIAIGVKYSF